MFGDGGGAGEVTSDFFLVGDDRYGMSVIVSMPPYIAGLAGLVWIHVHCRFPFIKIR